MRQSTKLAATRVRLRRACLPARWRLTRLATGLRELDAGLQASLPTRIIAVRAGIPSNRIRRAAR